MERVSRSVKSISSEVAESPREGHGQYIPFKRRNGMPGTRSKTLSTEEINALEANDQFADTEVIGIISIDGTGKILFSNSKAQSIFQCPELTGSSIHDFVPNNYMGTDKFQKRHVHLIKQFFNKPFAGGRMLDPGTILRAKLKSGKLVPLNIGLEAKINNKTGKPRLVVGYITEAATIIDQSKVEKMLSRATLVVIQQILAQAILSIIFATELLSMSKLSYAGISDETSKLTLCKEYTSKELSTDGEDGADYKMLLYMISTALTILISILPLFVNHMHDHETDEKTNHYGSGKQLMIYLANSINDFQESLSMIKTFRKTDLVFVTTLVCTVNIFLLYELKSLPNEYEIQSVKKCEKNARDKFNVSIVMCILGVLPFLYYVFKRASKYLRTTLSIYTAPKIYNLDPISESDEEEGGRQSMFMGKRFSSRASVASGPDVPTGCPFMGVEVSQSEVTILDPDVLEQ